MKVTKKDVKKFVKEHKNELTIAGVGILGAVLGYGLCSKVRIGDCYVVHHEGMNRLLRDATKVYNNRGCVYTAVTDVPFKPEELGELGKDMLTLVKDDDVGFTHFIAIAKKV